MAIAEKKVESPLGHIHENLLITPKGEVFAIYRLAKLDCPLNDEEFFNNYLEDGEGVFSHDEFDYKLFDVPEGYDLDRHIEETITSVLVKDETELSTRYWRRAGEILKDEVQNNNYIQYLQVRLTKPVEIVDPVDFLRELNNQTKRFFKKMAGNRTTDKKPLRYYKDLEKMLYSDLQNYKSVDRVKEKELHRIMYYNFHRANQTPLSYVNVDAFNMQEGIVTNHNGYLTIEQLDKTHYISILPIIGTPDGTFGSAFVQQLRDTLPFPLETQIHVRLQRPEQDLKNVNKIRNRLYHQEKDRDQTDKPLDDDEVINSGEDTLQDLQRGMKEQTFRLAKTTILFIIAASSKEEMDQRIKNVQYAIGATKFKLYQPIVDQLALFHQSLLGVPYTLRLFEREMTTGYVWDLGLDVERNIGNNHGLPLGRVITKKSYRDAEEARQASSKIVWFNPALTKKAITGSRFTNGNTLIVGPPGQGKSVTVKYIFCWLPSLGQKVLYIDPKDETEDFFGKAINVYADNSDFKQFVDRVNFMRLSGEEKNRGLLDPLIFLEGEEAETAASEALEELGEVEKHPATSTAKKVLIKRAIKQTMKHITPNMTRVIEYIRQEDTELAEHLEGYDKTIGRVLFGRDDSRRIDFGNPITVLGIAGLKLQTVEEVKEQKKMTPLQRVSQVIMENVYRLVTIFSTDRNQDAAIIFDEAGGLENTASGREKMDDSLRKGRANNTDIYLVTQAEGDFASEQKKELISYKFVFRPNDKEAQERSLRFLNLKVNDENKDVINRLKQGTCLFQDHLGRTQPIVIDVLFEEWLMACSSTDKTDERIKRALELEGRQSIA
ncbi:type VI secretion protein [Listeria booriae]|uniref:Type VI secretion protein n=1 Tax=Listeria booriae TaxID=1552123 RepID=A0A7X1BW94_9LIST|nr:ATP-binding protein [Listeria booriae]MBC1333536.1 type VI secretion protein [Listeria booriae]MBC1618034.1 type VI secretion protein [Listeria booriae]